MPLPPLQPPIHRADTVIPSPDGPDAGHGYRDYVGVLHIHTRYSDGAGTYEEIARIANAQRLDYLIVTDHNTLQPLRDGKQGWYGATLVLVGTEISAQAGHYLALNVTQEIDRSRLTTQQIIDEVNRQGGLGFIAHPYFQKRRWTDWTVTGFTGIEGYNVAHDSLDENRIRLVLWTLGVPTEPFYLSIVDRPYDPLSTWDRLLAQRWPVVGIGASDAHEVRVLGVKFAPYDVMFRLSRTHVLIPSDTLTAEAVYEALRKGHAYFSMELVTEASGVSFTAEDGDRVVGIMGDEVRLTPALRLNVRLPISAYLVMFRDGHTLATAIEREWTLPVTEPGVYRFEATRHGKPWVFSNPIRVLPTEAGYPPEQGGWLKEVPEPEGRGPTEAGTPPVAGSPTGVPEAAGERPTEPGHPAAGGVGEGSAERRSPRPIETSQPSRADEPLRDAPQPGGQPPAEPTDTPGESTAAPSEQPATGGQPPSDGAAAPPVE